MRQPERDGNGSQDRHRAVSLATFELADGFRVDARLGGELGNGQVLRDAEESYGNSNVERDMWHVARESGTTPTAESTS